MIIASGFVFRAVSGAIAVHGSLTPWFILCTLMLSLFLALGKRRYELELFNGDEQKQRKVLTYYSTALLDQLITIVTAMTITSYSLYTATENSGDKHYMMLTIPFVIYGIFRYLYLIHIEKVGGKPEEILLSDKHIFTTVLLYGVSVVFIKGYLISM
jgi:4-hydroxybenzoate polyprenyltransferase